VIKIRAASKIFVILDPLTQRDGTSGKADRYRRKRCGRWCGKHRRLRHILVVYIRLD